MDLRFADEVFIAGSLINDKWDYRRNAVHGVSRGGDATTPLDRLQHRLLSE
jgi:hypothetical protein